MWLNIIAGLFALWSFLSGWLKKREGARDQRDRDLEDNQKAAEKGKKIDEDVDKMDDNQLDDELGKYQRGF